MLLGSVVRGKAFKVATTNGSSLAPNATDTMTTLAQAERWISEHIKPKP
jgi:hypothetical protein